MATRRMREWVYAAWAARANRGIKRGPRAAHDDYIARILTTRFVRRVRRRRKTMKPGFYTIMAAQFFSSLADNALLIAAIALLRDLDEPGWMTPALKQSFVL